MVDAARVTHEKEAADDARSRRSQKSEPEALPTSSSLLATTRNAMANELDAAFTGTPTGVPAIALVTLQRRLSQAYDEQLRSRRDANTGH